jgi:uncharacterized protein YndB with AHSA1/START domain
MSDLPTYVLERMFDAPRALVWKAWTDPDLLPRWYGSGAKSTIRRFELKAGGLWLSEMQWGGKVKYDRVEFTQVSPPERLVWLHASADADWNIVASPAMKDWPRMLLTVVTFDEAGDKTKLRLTWTPHEASAAEIACFAAMLGSMDKGWGGGMALLEKLLAELQA